MDDGSVSEAVVQKFSDIKPAAEGNIAFTSRRPGQNEKISGIEILKPW
jgi:hypothetical protein